MARLILLPVFFWSALVLGAVDDSGRVVFDYQMNCQGCHTPDGAGAGSVPTMKGHVGVFLQSQEGREYLVRVPGSATSALSDERLAAVLNWIMYEFAGDSLQLPFAPYTAAEVAPLREKPLNEVDAYRERLLRAIAGADARE
ncbi:MAG: cytochrome c, class I [Haliea sp.]|uniref:c-type cytochrome n=1 Tax=Haliea sp. TaxID=1932666 RepID=UPI0032EF1B1B